MQSLNQWVGPALSLIDNHMHTLHRHQFRKMVAHERGMLVYLEETRTHAAAPCYRASDEWQYAE